MIQHRCAEFATDLSVDLDLIAAHTKRALLWPLLDPWLSGRRGKTAHTTSPVKTVPWRSVIRLSSRLSSLEPSPSPPLAAHCGDVAFATRRRHCSR